MSKVSPRERAAILQSLAAGVVPSIGLHHIQVGRLNEVDALVGDLKLVEQCGASVRFIVGRFGSGKTFFLNLIRNVAQKRKFVVAQADITTDRRFQGTGGQAKSLYSELMRNLSTRSRPDGNALQNVACCFVWGATFMITTASWGFQPRSATHFQFTRNGCALIGINLFSSSKDHPVTSNFCTRSMHIRVRNRPTKTKKVLAILAQCHPDFQTRCTNISPEKRI